MPESTPSEKARFGEPAKWLPVSFIAGQICWLWTVYNIFHCIPLLSDPLTSRGGTLQLFVFNFVAVMLAICYFRSVSTHPGTIPDKEEVGHTYWEYVAQDQRVYGTGPDAAGFNLQETKRSGDRRHCKWCAKYKPDRCHHCRVCRTCILKMDHHCPWIYNCVGFANHKFFFLLLMYCVIATHMIVWGMLHSVRNSVDAETPFVKMFCLLFGETLAAFLGLLVTIFFTFHIWLMFKAMTTIEFCEKSMKRAAYDPSVYDKGWLGNVKSVLGDNPLLWFLPLSPPSGDGLGFLTEETPMRLSRDMEAGRDSRRKLAEDVEHKKPKSKKRSEAAGTGEQTSDVSCQDESDHGAEYSHEAAADLGTGARARTSAADPGGRPTPLDNTFAGIAS